MLACSTHSMVGCTSCTGTGSLCPDPLASAQRLCLGMDSMQLCDNFDAMCAAAGADLSYFCTREGASYDPPMRMYFHTGIDDMILFRGWVPSSTGNYIASILVVLLAGIFVSALRSYRACNEAYFRIRENMVRPCLLFVSLFTFY